MSTSAQQRESRLQERYLCNNTGSPIRALAGTKVLSVKVHDISRSGIGLVTDQPISPNKPLLVEMFDHGAASWQLRATWAIHCTERGEGEWLVGCSFFRRFTEHELESLLGDAMPRAL